jgi:hypothetical protein
MVFMADRLKRASVARLAVAMAVLAFPLLAVGTAQAAIAGASPESTTNRPDLVSATVLNSTNVLVCFDKQLNNLNFGTGGPPNNNLSFLLGGYRSARTVQAALTAIEQTVDTTGKCVRATFSSAAIGDIGQYTVFTVLAGAVQTIGGITNPFSDSTSLTVPTALTPTHNGTTGFTVTPDLVGVLVDPTSNTITYTEDQNVATAPAPVAGNFTFIRPGGTTPCAGMGTPIVNGSNVTVLFGPVATCPVSDAARAGYTVGAVQAAADPTIAGTPDTAIVPASNTSSGTGTTGLPDLISTTEEANGGAIDYVFDKTVSVTAAGQAAGGFVAILAGGGGVGSTGASVINTSNTSTTVRVTFNLGGAFDLSQFIEYVVKGEVMAGSVQETSPPNLLNVADVRPAGGNAGAFARGFTTGPDVFNGIINKTTGVLTAGLDQRILIDVPAGIQLLDSTGNSVAAAGVGSVTFPSQAAGPETITVQFSPGQSVNATNVSFAGGSIFTPAVAHANVPQILSITSTSSLLHSARLHRNQSKAAVARWRRHVRAWEKARLARFLHSLHHRG